MYGPLFKHFWNATGPNNALLDSPGIDMQLDEPGHPLGQHICPSGHAGGHMGQLGGLIGRTARHRLSKSVTCLKRVKKQVDSI